eukprot:10023662-Ditylum_brightwellii.AAC.1
MPVQANSNAFGKKIVCPLGDGLIFCVFWTDANLDENYLKISISDDGYRVVQKQAKPVPENAADLIKKFVWSRQPNHFVVRCFDAE